MKHKAKRKIYFLESVLLVILAVMALIPAAAAGIKDVPEAELVVVQTGEKRTNDGTLVQAPLHDVYYAIYKDEDCTDQVMGNAKYGRQKNLFKTDRKGIITAELAEGTYYAKQIHAPRGYEAEDEVIVLTTEHENVQTSALKRGTVTVKNYEKGVNTALAGSEFQLWQKYDGKAYWYNCRKDVQVETAVTNENGEIVFTAPVGTYYIKQSVPAFGYLENRMLRFLVVTISDNGDARMIPVASEPYYGSVVLSQTAQKFGADGKLVDVPLKGVSYQFYTDAACTAPVADGAVFKTDAEGMIRLDDLRAGTYYAKQVRVPAGYVLRDEALAMGIIDAPEKELTLPVHNVLKTGTVVVNNENVSDNCMLEGASFELWAKYDGSIRWDHPTGEDVMIAEAVTDENGQIVFTAPAGTYYVKQSVAPFGFKELDPALFLWSTAKIADQDDTTALTFHSERYYGGIELVQYGEKRVGGTVVSEPMHGVYYAIYKDEACTEQLNGPEKNGLFKTDAEGKISVDMVPAGHYYAKQARVPANYVLDTQVIDLGLLDYEGEVLTAEAQVELFRGTFYMSYTENNGTPVVGAQFEVWQKFTDKNGRRQNIKVADVVTDENGLVQLDNLLAGDCYVKEVEPAEGYESVSWALAMLGEMRLSVTHPSISFSLTAVPVE